MFNLIEELFAPGRKHTDDEQRRLEHTRVEEGSNDPGKGPIDLASGHVLIRPPGQRTAPQEAVHLCMMMRGVEKQNSSTITSALRGRFRDCPMTRDEFLRLAYRPGIA